jgi:ligand-binding sensor domain-containing protein
MINPGSGGGETTNGYVTGSLVFQDGTPAANAQVKLINEKYNPIKDGKIADSLIDTTDEQGNFIIHIPSSGIFNIEALSHVNGTRTLIQQIAAEDDTILVPVDTMRAPGVLRVILPQSTQQTAGHLFIRGTTFYLPVGTQKDTVVIDSLPAGSIPDIILEQLSGTHLIAKHAYVPSGGISQIETGIIKTVFSKINNDTLFDFTTTCRLDNSGNIWIGTGNGNLFEFNKVNIWKQFSIPNHTIRCHEIDRNGHHWIGTNDGFYMFDGSVFNPSLIIAGDTIHSDIKNVFIDEKNMKWIVTSTTIYKEVSGSWQSTDNSNYGVSGYTDLLVDKSGTVWIGTMANGIIADYGTYQQNYSVSNSAIPSNTVNFIVQDSSGGIWAGTTAGLVRISGSNLYTFTRNNGGIKYYDVSHGVVDSSGDLWFSGDGTNLCNFRNSQVYPTSILWGKYTTIESIDFDQSGVIWSGSYGGGLVRIDLTSQP